MKKKIFFVAGDLNLGVEYICIINKSDFDIYNYINIILVLILFKNKENNIKFI